MNNPTWVIDEVVLTIHDMLLAKHGGGQGIRDEGLLNSALDRPKQKFHYQPDITIFEIAAAYSFGLAKNHPFIDGNKRTAFTIGTLFLQLNGYGLIASEVDATITFKNLASDVVDEKVLTLWFQKNSRKI